MLPNRSSVEAGKLPALTSILLPIFLLAARPALAQEPPLNAVELSNFDQAGQSYADVWGDGDYAYVAHYGQSRVDIVDISDPTDPQLAATYNTGGGSAQDVKAGDGLMFVGLESSAVGVHIVDVRDPTHPVKLTNVTVRSSVHNVFYHQGWLYIVDSSAAVVDIVDLRSYDPDNPPATISSPTWRLTGVGLFVHDITVQGNYLFASAWNSIRVYDISNLASQAPVFLDAANGNSVHSAWATDDLKFLVTAEERTGGGLTLFELVPETGSAQGISLVKRDTFALSTSRSTSVHNPVISGYTVFASWYQAGVQVLEILPSLKRFSLVASFDTTAAQGGGGFQGCWGIYPLLGSDRVLASDISTGLWVLDFDLSPGPTVKLTGSCPGEVRASVSGAAPNGEVALIAAGSTTGFTKRGGLCQGATLEIGEPFVLPPTFVVVDESGSGSRWMILGAGACTVEGLDFSTCKSSAPVSPSSSD